MSDFNNLIWNDLEKTVVPTRLFLSTGTVGYLDFSIDMTES